MGKDYGDPLRHDPDFSGPIRNRSCTDIIWLIIFILFLGVWGYVGYYGITNGNVEKLLAPMDMKGKRCGLDSTLEDKKYLVFFNIAECLSPTTPISGCKTPQVCVKECPKSTLVFKNLPESDFANWKKSMVCLDELDSASMTYSQAMQYIETDKCASYVLKSEPVLSRCIGDLSTLPCHNQDTKAQLSETTCVRNPKEGQKRLLEKATVLDSYLGWTAAKWVKFLTSGNERDAHILSSQIVQDLVQSRWYMAGALVAVVVLCFLYILVLRWVVTPVVWISIVGLIALLAFLCYLCWEQYVFYKNSPAGLYSTTFSLQGYAQEIFSKHQTWLALLIILAIVLIIVLLIVIFLRNRITIAIALIREGSKAVIDIKSTVFFPIFPWIIQCCVIAYGVTVLVYLLSVGEPAFKVIGLNETCECNGVYKEQQSCDPVKFRLSCHDKYNAMKPCSDASCHFTGLDSPHNVVFMHLVNLLGFWWAMFFISGCADMILAGAFATWYWTFNKRNVPFWTLTTGIYRTVCFHLGTVAFGALIIAIVRVIRIILEYIDHKLKKFDNPFTRCVLCCCKCFFWCLENFLKFINKNAYIMCAVHGKNFCTSARDAFSLLMRNIVRVFVLDKVTDFIFLLSKLLLSIGVGVAVFYLLELKFVYELTNGQRLNYNYVPAVILSVATYLISSIFFNVYAMAVDTLFLCFLEDCERNDGSPEKKYLMSKDLMRILGKKNKKP